MPQDALSRLSERVEQQFFGKYRATVASNKDPLKLGRLQLKIPSVLGTSDDCVTDWAWPCVPYGGTGEQGAFFVPDEGAKVWAEFEEGNLDLPIWVGTFWSQPGGTTEIPTEAQDMEGGDEPKPERRVLKTSSGHVLEFSDVADKEAVRITHKDGAMLTMDEKGNVVIENKTASVIYLNSEDAELVITDENGNTILLNDAGTTITNKDGTVVDLAGDAVNVVAKEVQIKADTIKLGDGASEPAILGNSFASIYDAHTHMTALGPSGPPIPVPMPLAVPTNPAMSQVVKLK